MKYEEALLDANLALLLTPANTEIITYLSDCLIAN